jgi:hypothetical protein
VHTCQQFRQHWLSELGLRCHACAVLASATGQQGSCRRSCWWGTYIGVTTSFSMCTKEQNRQLQHAAHADTVFCLVLSHKATIAAFKVRSFRVAQGSWGPGPSADGQPLYIALMRFHCIAAGDQRWPYVPAGCALAGCAGSAGTGAPACMKARGCESDGLHAIVMRAQWGSLPPALYRCQ